MYSVVSYELCKQGFGKMGAITWESGPEKRTRQVKNGPSNGRRPLRVTVEEVEPILETCLNHQFYSLFLNL